jgi:glycosyltransferase involved in cell wall biosynthesis
MKVLQVISGNDIGGGLKHVLNICRSNRNIESSIYFIGGGEGKYNTEGIPFRNASISQTLRGDLSDFIKSQGFELVNFHGAKANFIYGIIHSFIKIPTAVTIHSDFRYDFLNSNMKQILYSPLVKYGLSKYKNYICASDFIKNIMIENKFKGNFYTSFNGIDIKERENDENNLRDKLNIPEDGFVFICVARFHPVKNHKKLIEGFRALSNKSKDVYLLLIGDGPLETELKEYAGDLTNIRFLGFRKNTWDYYGISDANILVSYSEGGEPPLVILEGGLKKLPIIASKISSIDESLYGCGYFVNPDSAKDICDKMMLLYSDREKGKIFGENLYDIVISKYSMQAFGDRYFSIYKSILDINRKVRR